MTCDFVLLFCMWLWGDEITMQKAKGVLKKEKIRSPNDA